jgi:hypothetical protein
MPTYVAVFALALAYVALVAAYLALRTLAKLRRETVLLARGLGIDSGQFADGTLGAQSIVEYAGRCAERSELAAEHASEAASRAASASAHVEGIHEQSARAGAQAAEATERTQTVAAELARLGERVDWISAARAGDAEVDGPLRNTALVRYDAFGDVTGRMSFSLALLDEQGHGVTISAIAGRSDTRVYAKGVTAAKGEQDLSPEERQAVAAAMSTRRGLLHRVTA